MEFPRKNEDSMKRKKEIISNFFVINTIVRLLEETKINHII